MITRRIAFAGPPALLLGAHGCATAPGAAIAQTPVDFVSGDLRMRGTLYMPFRRRPVPLVIAYHASGGGEANFPPYTHLREALPAAGIATFLFDRRGSNGQPGDFNAATFEDLARDGLAALEVLKQDPRVDANRIGAWGLSQGGWIAPLAATLSNEIRYVVSVSGSGVSPARQMAYAAAFHLREAEYSEEIVEAALGLRQRVDAYYRNPAAIEENQRIIDSYRDRPWFNLMFLPRNGALPADPATTKWRLEMDYNPTPVLQRLSVPVLAVFGRRDRWVPVEASVEAMRAAIQPPAELTVYQSYRSGHYLSGHDEPADFTGDDETDSDYLLTLTNWIEDL